MKSSKTYWETLYAGQSAEELQYDLWLDPFLSELQAGDGLPVLDLGCGAGNNALYLTERGVPVVACDLSEEALKLVSERVPEVSTLVLNLLEPLPFGDGTAPAIVADLSLHYFHWADTERIVAELRRVLKPGGLLLCRVNSIRDTEYGAGQGTELEPGLYESGGRIKRFFERDQAEALFANWTIEVLEENVLLRYEKPKRAWMVAARRDWA